MCNIYKKVCSVSLLKANFLQCCIQFEDEYNCQSFEWDPKSLTQDSFETNCLGSYWYNHILTERWYLLFWPKLGNDILSISLKFFNMLLGKKYIICLGGQFGYIPGLESGSGWSLYWRMTHCSNLAYIDDMPSPSLNISQVWVWFSPYDSEWSMWIFQPTRYNQAIFIYSKRKRHHILQTIHSAIVWDTMPSLSQQMAPTSQPNASLHIATGLCWTLMSRYKMSTRW